MANTLNGIFADIISDKDLTTLLPALPQFRAFTTDFSTDIAQKGQSVTTRVGAAVSAAAMTTSGYTVTDVTSTAKTITLDQHYHFTMGFTDLEVAKGGLPMLERVFIRPAIHALAKQVVDATLARVLAAAFSGSRTITAAAFDADDMADLAGDLSANNVPEENRTLIAGWDYVTALKKDDAIQAAYAYGGSEVIRQDNLSRVHGFDVFGYSSVPANGEALEGIALHPEALLVAARVPLAPPPEDVRSLTVVEPTSGMPVQFREWYDANLGMWKYAATLIYGTLAGQGTCLIRVKSA